MTINFIEEYEKISSQEEELNEQDSKIAEAKNKHYDAKSNLIRQWIFEGKLLDSTTWDLCEIVDTNSTITIQCDLKNSPVQIQNIRKGWHDYFRLNESVGLYFDDNLLSLSFTSAEILMSFVKDTGITLVARDLNRKVEKAQKRLEGLQKLQEKLNV